MANLQNTRSHSRETPNRAYTRFPASESEQAHIQATALLDLPEATTSWEALLKAMTSHDDGMVKNWNDSMANLLVFTGLFSAVVTAFVIVSYTWLQENPADTTNILLSQILLLQMSSISGSSSHINTTAPAMTSAAQFEPSLRDVRINTLWLLSLAISLITAVFAILVQQWLQVFQFQGVTSVRESIRLRQMRFESLSHWGIPDIVALLPVMLQLAVILFLIGLLILLWSTNEVIAITITTFLVLPLVFFVTTALLPLVWSRCPYKSPMSTMLFTAKLFGEVVAAQLAVAVVYVFYYLAIGWIGAQAYCGSENAALKTTVRSLMSTVGLWTRSSSARLTLRGQWITRDVEDMTKLERDLDMAAVLWGPSAMSSSKLWQLEGCLTDLPLEERARCALAWAVASFRLNNAEVRTLSHRADAMLFIWRDTIPLDEEMVTRHRRLLIKSLPRWDSEQGVTVTGPSMLTLIRHLVQVAPPLDPAHAAKYSTSLRAARANVFPVKFSDIREADRFRILARCTFDLWSMGDIVTVDEQEIREFVKWALNLFMAAYPVDGNDDWSRNSFECHDGIICALASAFLIHSKHPDVERDASILRQLVRALQHFLECEKENIGDYTEVSFDAFHSTLAGSVSRTVWPTLCASLRSLADYNLNILPKREMSELTYQLIDVCARGNGHLRSLIPTLEHLRRLYPRTSGSPATGAPGHTSYRPRAAVSAAGTPAPLGSAQKLLWPKEMVSERSHVVDGFSTRPAAGRVGRAEAVGERPKATLRRSSSETSRR